MTARGLVEEGLATFRASPEPEVPEEGTRPTRRNSEFSATVASQFDFLFGGTVIAAHDPWKQRHSEAGETTQLRPSLPPSLSLW